MKKLDFVWGNIINFNINENNMIKLTKILNEIKLNESSFKGKSGSFSKYTIDTLLYAIDINGDNWFELNYKKHFTNKFPKEEIEDWFGDEFDSQDNLEFSLEKGSISVFDFLSPAGVTYVVSEIINRAGEELFSDLDSMKESETQKILGELSKVDKNIKKEYQEYILFGK